MSDETSKVDREAYRRDEAGNLTVWGARDVLLELALGKRAAGAHAAEIFHREVSAALDDVEDAYLRTHEAFGCHGMRDDARASVRRFTCADCRAQAITCRDEDLAESLAQYRRGEVLPALTAAEERMRSTLREALEVGHEGGILREDTLALLARRACEAAGYEALARDECAGRVAEDSPAWYDRPGTADQEDQVDARDDQAGPAVGRVGWETLGLQEALEVRPGDHLSFTLESQEDGRLQVRSLHVIRADELEDDDDETGDE